MFQACGRVSGFVLANPELEKSAGTKEDRDVSAANRYSLQIEIAGTPTKQTVGTRANRYNLAIFRGSTSRLSRAESRGAEQREPRDPSPLKNFAPSSPRAQNSNNENAIRNRRK